MTIKLKKNFIFPELEKIKDPLMKETLSLLFRELSINIRDIYDDLTKSFNSRVTSLPSASVDYIGRFYLVEQGGAVDKLYICVYNTSGSSYEWKEVSYV